MYQLTKKLLFKLPAEAAHNLSLKAISLVHKFGCSCLFSKPMDLPKQVMGINFSNPIGLAAGMDKNGDHIDGLGALGFGFLELGTVTPIEQFGNPAPRLFRLPEKEAFINRMGFNNKGVDYLISKVHQSKYPGIIGINIGKNAQTPFENANDDYKLCFEKAYPFADYITVNISSPNTLELRDLQFGDALKSLLNMLKETQVTLINRYQRKVPIAIKIAPDMSEQDIKSVAKNLLAYEIDGVIATNTTLTKDQVCNLEYGKEIGGLSGAPLSEISTQVIELLSREVGKKIAIIGVGGVMDAKTATQKIKAGADLLQIYSGLVYKGPSVLKEVAEATYFA